MGGTQIYDPLLEIYSKNPKPRFPRTLFLITDGAVSNPDIVVQLIKNNVENGTRVHTFGIGHGVSTYLINEAALAGAGTASFVAGNEHAE